jgi:hypothetical protein
MAQADASGGNLTELNSIADFEAVASPNGYVSICGFGSLLSGNSFIYNLAKPVIEY